MLVLVADEDAALQDATRRAVERFGYRCVVASSGTGAWEQIVASRPDVVLASLGLGGVGGLGLAKRVRELRHQTAATSSRWLASTMARACSRRWRRAPTTS